MTLGCANVQSRVISILWGFIKKLKYSKKYAIMNSNKNYKIKIDMELLWILMKSFRN